MSRAKGERAETSACEFLRSLGFEVLERNFYTRYGEIDIIARKNDVLHFIEVKSGSGFEPIFNITPQKIAKLTKTLKIYLAKSKISLPYCLDALIIREAESIELIENITL